MFAKKNNFLLRLFIYSSVADLTIHVNDTLYLITYFYPQNGPLCEFIWRLWQLPCNGRILVVNCVLLRNHAITATDLKKPSVSLWQRILSFHSLYCWRSAGDCGESNFWNATLPAKVVKIVHACSDDSKFLFKLIT